MSAPENEAPTGMPESKAAISTPEKEAARHAPESEDAPGTSEREAAWDAPGEEAWASEAQLSESEAGLSAIGAITDARLKSTMLRAMRLVVILTVVLGLVLWFAAGWRTALLLVVGAAISVSSLWEWQKLLAVISAKLENRQGAGGARVIVGFFVRLLIAAVVLYGSLKSLHGSVFALVGGLALAMVALAIEGVRLVRS